MARTAAAEPVSGMGRGINDKYSIASMRRKGQRAGLAACALALSGMLAACQTVQTSYQPPVQIPEKFTATGDEVLPDRWWRSFGDPVLDDLMGQGLSGSLTIRAAWDRLAQARATAKKAGASLLPTLDGEAGVSRTRQKARTASGGNRRVSSTTDISLGLVSSYEVDLWGQLRSTRDAALYDADASEEDVRTAAITLSAEIADTWYQLVEQYGQIDLLRDQTETARQVLEVVTLRFRQGQVQASDVLQQRQFVESNLGDQILAEAQAQVLEHQLAILLGRAPTDLELPRINALVTLPPLPGTGVTADLINRRPDIRKAYYGVLAADRRAAAAVADRFPQISLSAQASTSAERVKDIFDNWLASLAANLVAPLFDGGERKAEVERTRAVTSEALNDYGQTVLDSLGEVEDALVQESSQRHYIASLEKQMELADQASERLRDTYVIGGADYLSVLDSLQSIQSLERSYLQAQRQLIEYRIELCRALAGGWEMTPPDGTVLADQDNATLAPKAVTGERHGG